MSSGANRGGTGGGVTRRPRQRTPEAPPQIVPVEWIEGTVVMPAPEDGVETPDRNQSGAAGALGALGSRSRNNNSPYIEEFEAALNTGRPIVIWVYTESSERRLRRSREQSQRFFDEVLNTPAATAKLSQCVCIRIEGEDLDRDLARRYRLNRTRIPQLVIYDYEGEKIGGISTSANTEAVAAAIENALNRCEAMLERER